MLPEPLDFQDNYLPISPAIGGLSGITAQQLAPPQHQLLGQNQGLQGPTDLRSMLLERFRQGFSGGY